MTAKRPATPPVITPAQKAASAARKAAAQKKTAIQMKNRQALGLPVPKAYAKPGIGQGRKPVAPTKSVAPVLKGIGKALQQAQAKKVVRPTRPVSKGIKKK